MWLEDVPDIVDEVVESPLIGDIGVEVNMFQVRMGLLLLLTPVLEELPHQVAVLLVAIGQ